MERVRRTVFTLFFIVTMIASLMMLSAPVLVAAGDILISLLLASRFACARCYGFREHMDRYGFTISLMDIPLASIIRSLVLTCKMSFFFIVKSSTFIDQSSSYVFSFKFLLISSYFVTSKFNSYAFSTSGMLLLLILQRSYDYSFTSEQTILPFLSLLFVASMINDSYHKFFFFPIPKHFFSCCFFVLKCLEHAEILC